jgi:hypothetical protein
MGIAVGFLHLEGIFVIIGFISLMYLLSYLYSSKMLNVSDEEFPNNELLMEGVSNSLGIFLVSKIS